MIRKKGYEMKDYAAWLKAWETYNLHFYSVPAWVSLALVLDLIAGIAFAVARDVAKKEQPARPGLLVNTMLVVSLAFAMLGGKRCPLTEPPAGKDNHNQPSERKTR